MIGPVAATRPAVGDRAPGPPAPARQRGLAGALVGGASLVLAGVASAQPAPPAQWPARPIRLLVGFPVGGAADLLARLHASRLQEALRESVVVDNRGGAGGVIATELAARAEPDGHTLLFTSLPHVINPALYRKVAYDPVRDFQPVTLLVNVPLLLVAGPGLPAKSVRELISAARAAPGRLQYASAGNGSSSHLAMVLFASMAAIDLQHIPYKGTGPAIADLVAGQVGLTLASIVPLLPQVRAGRLRPLAVTGRQRSGTLPEVPTVAEAGLPGYDMTNWFGVLAPARIPSAVLSRLDTELRAIVASPEARERYAAQGADPVGAGPEAFARVIREDLPRWARVVRESGARVD
ncbi:MAG: tripartite tricarboxylate transporter substrate binding protein [Pseudomonadota bacterium]